MTVENTTERELSKKKNISEKMMSISDKYGVYI